MTSSHMTLSDLKKSNFRNLISHKGAELGHILILNTNRKIYSAITLSHLILSDIERSKSRSLKF